MIAEKIKILVAEDEELIRWALKRSLEAAGYSVDIAVTGKEALQKIKEYNYDIIVTDLDMPELNGLEMLIKMKEMGIFPRVIVISAYLTEKITERIKEEIFCKDALRCIKKPFQMENVINVVKEVVEYKIKGEFL